MEGGITEAGWGGKSLQFPNLNMGVGVRVGDNEEEEVAETKRSLFQV